MVCYSQQITQWFTGSPIIRGHTLLKELQCTWRHLLKGKEQCLILSFLKHILAATAQTCCRGRRGQKAPLHMSQGSDYATQAGWGSLAPWREQQKARPGQGSYFCTQEENTCYILLGAGQSFMPQWSPAPPSLSTCPKSLFPHSILLRILVPSQKQGNSPMSVRSVQCTDCS